MITTPEELEGCLKIHDQIVTIVVSPESNLRGLTKVLLEKLASNGCHCIQQLTLTGSAREEEPFDLYSFLEALGKTLSCEYLQIGPFDEFPLSYLPCLLQRKQQQRSNHDLHTLILDDCNTYNTRRRFTTSLPSDLNKDHCKGSLISFAGTIFMNLSSNSDWKGLIHLFEMLGPNLQGDMAATKSLIVRIHSCFNLEEMEESLLYDLGKVVAPTRELTLVASHGKNHRQDFSSFCLGVFSNSLVEKCRIQVMDDKSHAIVLKIVEGMKEMALCLTRLSLSLWHIRQDETERLLSTLEDVVECQESLVDISLDAVSTSIPLTDKMKMFLTLNQNERRQRLRCLEQDENNYLPRAWVELILPPSHTSISEKNKNKHGDIAELSCLYYTIRSKPQIYAFLAL